MGIKYTLKSENNSVVRDLEIDDSGNYFIEANKNDLATFSTQYPETLVEGLYWGKGTDKEGKANDSDYLYIAKDDETVTVSDSVALDDLELKRLDMFGVFIFTAVKTFITLKKIYINNIEVAHPNADLTVESGFTNIAEYIENYMSIAKWYVFEFSAVISIRGRDFSVDGRCVDGRTVSIIFDLPAN